MSSPISSAANPNAPALITDAFTLCYHELAVQVETLCKQLKNWGVEERDRVAFSCTNNQKIILLYLALFKLNAVACPFNPRLPEPRKERILSAFAPKFVIDLEEMSCTRAASTKSEPSIAVLMPTSGSSGPEKIVALSFENLRSSAEGSTMRLPLETDDRWLLPLPLFHVSGLILLFRVLLKGAALIISNLPLAKSLEAHRATLASLVPTQLFRLCRDLPSSPSHLKGALLGGAALSPRLFEEAISKGYKIFSSYGMTEMCAAMTLDLSPKVEGNRLTAGRLLPYRELKLSDEGEILVRGRTLFLGYWDREKGLNLPLDAEGWFHTKDRGAVTEDGRLLVLGRRDSLFISGGENIFPEEIESVLLSLPGILEALVLPHPDEEFGQVAHAFISSELPFSEETLLAQLKTLLPRHMLPRRIFPFPATSEPGIKRSRK
ncbi:MAG: o-succinylbenzoate--CoA ligase [Chlamydiales bacterium]|nr:o-succinylbenzoate--CoA ligase [Chlamydiales bacterium]